MQLIVWNLKKVSQIESCFFRHYFCLLNRFSLLNFSIVAMKMGIDGLGNAWPLQRLIQMVNFAQIKNKESWKELPVLSSNFTEVFLLNANARISFNMCDFNVSVKFFNYVCLNVKQTTNRPTIFFICQA